tara:strand:+ start:391 stop:495 length:105 start_codon:yes stop_codon:yes gene_type:complete
MFEVIQFVMIVMVGNGILEALFEPVATVAAATSG